MPLFARLRDRAPLPTSLRTSPGPDSSKKRGINQAGFFATRAASRPGLLFSRRHDHPSADADKCTPQGSENGARQNVSWTPTERAAISAHFDAKRANFLITGGIEQGRQDRQYGGHKVHGDTPELFSLAESAQSFRAGAAYPVAQGLSSRDIEAWNFRENLLQQGDKLFGTDGPAKADSTMVGGGADVPVSVRLTGIAPALFRDRA